MHYAIFVFIRIYEFIETFVVKDNVIQPTI